jgi:hypothetical protein
MTENELAELLPALEQTLSDLKATKDPGQRRPFLRKMRRLLAEIDRGWNASNRRRARQSLVLDSTP